jgi:hypothetical protein
MAFVGRQGGTRGRENMMAAFIGQRADMRRVCDCTIATGAC